MDLRCHGGRYSEFFKDPAMAEIYSHCPLCYAVDSQQHFFLECRYLKAEERQGSMEQEVREALATFRAGLADRPDLKDMVEMIVSTLNQ
jgi:hypothetical protein